MLRNTALHEKEVTDMRKNRLRISVLAVTLSAAFAVGMTVPAFGNRAYSVEAATQEGYKEYQEDFAKYAKKGLKVAFDGTLDGLSIAFPQFKPFATVIKGLGGILFDLGNGTTNPNAEVIKRIDQLEAEMKKSVQELKNNTYNVIQLANIGDKLNSLDDKAATIRKRIGNYERDINLTDEQRQKKIADLYEEGEFQCLESAMNGATRCFTSRDNDIFSNQNIFEAAYRRACEEVMFSGEAIDLTLPYLARQLSTYVTAYAVMAEVYDAYEAVYGAGSLSQSQEDMCIRLTGCDLNGEKVGKSVIDYYIEYFSGDRFIFVNKSNNVNIKLNQKMIARDQFHTSGVIKDPKHYGAWVETPNYMKNMPLSTEQMEALVTYCANKNITMFDLLLNRVGFEIPSIKHLGKKNREVTFWTYRNGVYKPKGMVQIMAGAQEFEKHRPGGGSCWVTYNTYDMTGTLRGCLPVVMTQATVEAHGAMCENIVYDSPHLVFFQGR